MHVSQLKQSRFLTRADVGTGVLVTIADIYQDNVAKEGAPEEYKWAISFTELEKPMVLNSTNGQMIAKICGSEETDDWVGHKIVLYDEPNISFGGKLVGGIRVRAPRKAVAPQETVPIPPKAPARPQPRPQTSQQHRPAPRPAAPAPAQEPAPVDPGPDSEVDLPEPEEEVQF